MLPWMAPVVCPREWLSWVFPQLLLLGYIREIRPSARGPDEGGRQTDRLTDKIRLSRGPGLLALPWGEPDTGDRLFFSFKHPELLRWVGLWKLQSSATEPRHGIDFLLCIQSSVISFKTSDVLQYIIYINMYRMHKYKHMCNLSINRIYQLKKTTTTSLCRLLFSPEHVTGNCIKKAYSYKAKSAFHRNKLESRILIPSKLKLQMNHRYN